jgi:hypothetical protein
MKRWLRKVLNLHSPSRSMIGKCRCKMCVEIMFAHWAKPRDYVTTTCTPGKTMLRMHRGDQAVAVLVLKDITWQFDGPTTAEFVSLDAMQRYQP